jgi:release factor glutamine methyltransferase
MTVRTLLAHCGIERLDAEVLAAAALGRPRSWLVAHGDGELSPAEEEHVQSFIQRRRMGEPVAYITGQEEFFGRVFSVTPAVLIPRPSTEHLVSLALRFLRHPADETVEVDVNISVAARLLRSLGTPRVIVDVGTGSGCVGISLALEEPSLRVIATDVSMPALAVARSNAELHGVGDRFSLCHGRGLACTRELHEPFLVVTNPPYIPVGTLLPRDVFSFEPHRALFGGEDGLRVLRGILREAAEHPLCAGVVFECQTDQVPLALRLLAWGD